MTGAVDHKARHIMNIRSLRRARALAISTGLLMALSQFSAQAAQPAPVQLADLADIQDISSPLTSPDGQHVLYTVATTDTHADRVVRQLWQVALHGGPAQLVLDGQQAFSHVQWLPDGSGISFLAADQGRPQLWKVGLQRTTPVVLTGVSGVISDYQWRPDGQQLALTYSPIAPPQPGQPLVIDRYEFKRDGVGYLPGNDVAQIYLLRLDGSEPQRLTGASDFAQTSARWSPDGHSIAYIATQDQAANAVRRETLFITAATADSTPRPLGVARSGNGNEPVWAPDGKSLVFLGSDDPLHDFRRHQYLTSVNIATGATQRLSTALDLDVAFGRPPITLQESQAAFSSPT